MSATQNWWHSDVPTPTPPSPAGPIEWLRETPRPRPAPPVRRPAPPRPILRLADAMVRAGAALIFATFGSLIGFGLVALTSLLIFGTTHP